MNPQLELLLQLQDLDLMIRELGNEKTASAEKNLGFELSGVETIQKARTQLAKKIEPPWLKGYERIVGRFPRAIVPMKDGICFGCFVRQPHKDSVDPAEDAQELECCQRCGRILCRFRFPKEGD